MEPRDRRDDHGQRIPLCGPHGCCPTAEFTDDNVILRDDYGGEVQLTRAEWSNLIARIKSGAFGT